jgi:hypothetical protein
MTLFITVNKKHICNVPLINVISKVNKSKVFISIVAVSTEEWCASLKLKNIRLAGERNN